MTQEKTSYSADALGLACLLRSVCYNDLGNVYLRLKEYNKAIEAFKRAIELDPTDASAYDRVGEVYSLLEQQNQARVAHQRALELDPQRYTSLLSLALIEQQAENQDQAAVLVDQARQLLLPDDFYNLARLESIAGNADAAIEALRIALEREEERPEWARDTPEFAFISDDLRYRAIVGIDSGER
jgi:tetratricopeptide (TPR) repeat protein